MGAMKIISEVSFDEVIHSWLQAEWYKPEYNQFRQTVPQAIIKNPDFANSGQNNIRSSLFYHGRSPMWSPLLVLSTWYKVQVVKADIDKVYHCACDEWEPITEKSFRVERTIENLNGLMQGEITQKIVQTVERIHAGLTEDAVVDGLVMIGLRPDSNLTVIEGNHRFTAVCAKHNNKGHDTIISNCGYLGIHPEMNNYRFHIGKRIPHLG